VRFAAYTDDHLPPHVHGFYAGAEVIMDLLFKEKKVRLARRSDNIKPANAKKSDVKRVRKAAKDHVIELIKLWKDARA
jgi:hypothetical protein